MPINPYPSPIGGQGAFGMVPGPIAMPTPAADVAAQYPNLSGTNRAISNTIMSQLQGSISPATLNALQDASARWGVASGMPGSGLALHNLFGNIAGFAEGQAQKGLENYGRIIPTISGTQTVQPGLQAEIAAQNALNLAAPDPRQAASYAESLFNKYLAGVRGAPQMPAPARTGTVMEQPTGSSFGGYGDRVYNSLATDVLSGGVPMGPAPTVPTTNLQAGGPATGTGQVYMGPSEGYTPDMPNFDTASDEEIMNWLTST